MTATEDTAVRHTIAVEAPQEKAFAVFTDGLDRWWPRSHKIGPEALEQAVLEGHEGGRWYERDTDGSECDWGHVLVWEPPDRLVLAWELTADWQHDPNFRTEVEVRFVAVGPDSTRVELEHRHLERYAEKAESMRAGLDSEGGWASLLKTFAAAAATPG